MEAEQEYIKNDKAEVFSTHYARMLALLSSYQSWWSYLWGHDIKDYAARVCERVAAYDAAAPVRQASMYYIRRLWHRFVGWFKGIKRKRRVVALANVLHALKPYTVVTIRAPLRRKPVLKSLNKLSTLNFSKKVKALVLQVTYDIIQLKFTFLPSEKAAMKGDGYSTEDRLPDTIQRHINHIQQQLSERIEACIAIVFDTQAFVELSYKFSALKMDHDVLWKQLFKMKEENGSNVVDEKYRVCCIKIKSGFVLLVETIETLLEDLDCYSAIHQERKESYTSLVLHGRVSLSSYIEFYMNSRDMNEVFYQKRISYIGQLTDDNPYLGEQLCHTIQHVAQLYQTYYQNFLELLDQQKAAIVWQLQDQLALREKVQTHWSELAAYLKKDTRWLHSIECREEVKNIFFNEIFLQQIQQIKILATDPKNHPQGRRDCSFYWLHQHVTQEAELVAAQLKEFWVMVDVLHTWREQLQQWDKRFKPTFSQLGRLSFKKAPPHVLLEHWALLQEARSSFQAITVPIGLSFRCDIGCIDGKTMLPTEIRTQPEIYEDPHTHKMTYGYFGAQIFDFIDRMYLSLSSAVLLFQVERNTWFLQGRTADGQRILVKNPWSKVFTQKLAKHALASFSTEVYPGSFDISHWCNGGGYELSIALAKYWGRPAFYWIRSDVSSALIQRPVLQQALQHCYDCYYRGHAMHLEKYDQQFETARLRLLKTLLASPVLAPIISNEVTVPKKTKQMTKDAEPEVHTEVFFTVGVAVAQTDSILWHSAVCMLNTDVIAPAVMPLSTPRGIEKAIVPYSPIDPIGIKAIEFERMHYLVTPTSQLTLKFRVHIQRLFAIEAFLVDNFYALRDVLHLAIYNYRCDDIREWIAKIQADLVLESGIDAYRRQYNRLLRAPYHFDNLPRSPVGKDLLTCVAATEKARIIAPHQFYKWLRKAEAGREFAKSIQASLDRVEHCFHALNLFDHERLAKMIMEDVVFQPSITAQLPLRWHRDRMTVRWNYRLQLQSEENLYRLTRYRLRETERADMQAERAEEQTRRAEEQTRRAQCAETLVRTLFGSHLHFIGFVYQSQDAPEHGHQFYKAVAHYLGMSTQALRECVRETLQKQQQDPPAALSQLFSRAALTIAGHINQLTAEVEVDADLESAILSFVLQRPILVLSLYGKIGVALADVACIDQLGQDPIFVFKHPECTYFEGVGRSDDFEAITTIRDLMLKMNTQKVARGQVSSVGAVTTIGIFGGGAVTATAEVETRNSLGVQQ